MLNTGTHITGAADNALTALRGGAARSGYPCTSSLCERRALDGVAAFGGAMKCEVVKRLRQRRKTSV
jgi:hypothetical protein